MMKKKIAIFLLILILLAIAFASGYWLSTKKSQQIQETIEPTTQITPTASALRRIGLYKIPHWNEVDHLKSLMVFQKSCQLLNKKNIAETQQTHLINLNTLQFRETCQKALKLGSKISSAEAKSFFENHFKAYTLKNPTKDVLFTGYYSPNFEGRLKKDSIYKYPIYAKPKNLIAISLKKFSKNLPDTFIYGKIQNRNFVPYDDRASISKGSIDKFSAVIAWVKNPMDALELEIQGAGIIRTPEKILHLNYAAQNGHPYEAVGKFLIQENIILKKNMSMTAIRQYFDNHPQDVDRIFNKNSSYVFFKTTPKSIFYGYQNIPLTSGYSMAVDKNTIPLGLPIFLKTKLPNQQQFYRLMIAQDIGGAIKGPYRGDIYFGTQQQAMQLAREMQSTGKYWILLPDTGKKHDKKSVS